MGNLVQRFVSVLVAFSLTCVLFLSGTVGTTASANSITIDNLVNARPATIDEITGDMADEAAALWNAYKGLLSGTNIFSNFIEWEHNYWYIIEDIGVLVLQPVIGVYYYFDEGVLMVDDSTYAGGGGIHSASHHEHSGSGGRRRATSDDPVISAEDFSETVNTLNSTIIPKNKNMVRLSYRNNSRYGGGESNSFWRLSWFANGQFCEQPWSEVYMSPFYYDGGAFYCSLYQVHFYFVSSVDSDDNPVLSLYVDLIENATQEVLCSNLVGDYFYGKNYIDVGALYDSRIYVAAYDSLSRYIAKQSTTNYYPNVIVDSVIQQVDFVTLHKQDLSDSVSASVVNKYFQNTYDNHTTGDTDDYGYLCCNVPLSLVYDFDTAKFTDNDTVVLSGDTIYDYTIVNNTTGDTTTINDYITNNYTYPTSDTPSDPESPSGDVNVGGNVGVSGNITVGGQVGVDVNVSPIDINVNVSDNGGSTGTSDGGEDINDYFEIDEDINTNVDDYVELVPEVSKGFIDYLKDFFAWLPKEIYGLLVLGLLVAVWCRLAGR